MLQKIPHGLDEIIAAYGHLDDALFEPKFIRSFQFPYPVFYDGARVTQTRCHKEAVDHFIKVFTLIDEAGLADQFKEYNGIYARRWIRGQASHPSLHSWGVALDMGASTHPLGRFVRWPAGIHAAFKEAGFFWGGEFISRKDSMHWQLATGY